MTRRAISRARARVVGDAGAAEEVTHLTIGAIAVIATPRSDATAASVALAVWRTVRVRHALCRHGHALAIWQTALVSGAVLVGGAEPRGDHALAIITDLARATVEIAQALGRRLGDTAPRVIADLARRAVEVGHAEVLADANLVDAGLVRAAIRIDRTLADELTLEEHAALARTALRVELTSRFRDAEAKLADLTERTIRIVRAVWWRNRQARPDHTLRAEGALVVGLATVWRLADVVVANHAGERAVTIGLTHERRRAASRGALPRRRTIAGILAGRRHAVPEIASLVRIAIGVEAAIGTRLAEEAVADRTGGALGVGGALTEVDAAIAETLEARLAIRIRETLDGGLASARDRLALLTRRAVRVARAAPRDGAEVVLAGLARVAVRVDAAVAREEAAAVDAVLVRGAVDVRLTLGHGGHARAVVTCLIWRTVEVGHARLDGNTHPLLAGKPRSAEDVGAEVDDLAAEVVADLVGCALIIVTAVADEEAGAIEANLARGAVHIIGATRRGHTLAGATDLVDATVSVRAALRLEDAAPIDADLGRAAVKITEAIGRLGDTAAVDADLVSGAVVVEATTWRWDTDAVLAQLVWIALEIIAATDKLAAARDASTAEAAVAILVTLGDKDTLAIEAGEVDRAIAAGRTLAKVEAEAIITNPARAAVVIDATLGEGASTIVTGGEAFRGHRAIRVDAALHISDTLALIADKPERAVRVGATLPFREAEAICAHRARAALFVRSALLNLAEALVTDDGARDIVGEELAAVLVASALAIEDTVAAVAEGARATLEIGVALAHIDAADTVSAELTCGALRVAHTLDAVRQALVEVIATALAVRTADLAALAISARRALALDALAALAVIRAVAILVAVAEATFWQAGPVDTRLTLGAIHIRDADRLGALAIDASLTSIAIRVGGANLRRLLVQACAIETDLTLSAFTIAGADKRRRAIIGDACRARTTIRVGLAPIVERCSATTAEE